MATVIAIVNSKGGVGKTTIATNLATMAGLDGNKVLLVDADPQRSALSYRTLRKEDDITAIAPSGKIREDLKRIGENFDLAIIDVGGHDSDILTEAMGAAHLVIVPIEPGQYQYASLKQFMARLATVAHAKEQVGVPFAARFLLTRIVAGSVVAKDFVDILDEFKDVASILPQKLVNRISYTYASMVGQAVTEYEPSGYAAAEFRVVYNAIKKTIEEL